MKYNSYDNIPAKVFFDIRKTQNYQLLCPKPGENPKKVFIEIFDEYFLKSENPDAKEYLLLTEESAFLRYKMGCLTSIVKFWWNIPSKMWNSKTVLQIVIQQMDALKISFDIHIDYDVPVMDEISRILNVEIGILKDELSICETRINEILKSNTKDVFDFYESLSALSDAHGRTLHAMILLPEYVAEEKRAIKKSEAIKLQNMKK